MPDGPLLKRWQHANFECIVWVREEGSINGAVIAHGQPVANIKVTDRRSQATVEQAVQAVAEVLRRDRGIWNLDPEPFTDVALSPSTGDPKETAAARLEVQIRLADDLYAIPCDWDFWKAVTAACDAPGIDLTTAIDLRARPLYAFARVNAPRTPVYGWDPDGRLQQCIALSRLVRPTSIGFDYSARIIGTLNGERSMIKPGPVRGFGAHAWTPEPERDWLDAGDWHQLGELLRAWDRDPFDKKSKLAQALWYHEYACRTQLIDIRVPLVSTALEALLSTSGQRSTQQFKKRVPQLASGLGVAQITTTMAGRMWGLRSSLSHGERHGGLSASDFDLARRMEELLRATLRQAIVDGEARSWFASRDAVNKRFPIEHTPRTVRCTSCGTPVPVE